MAKYLTEFLGTFFFVLIIGLSVGSGTTLAPIAIGIGLAILVYMGGHVSGAHYNPAITLGLLINGNIKITEAAIYWLVQLAASAAAAFLVGIMVQDQSFVFTVAPAESASPVQVLLVETLFTFLLVITVMNVAVAKKTAGNSYFGLAIGGAVMAAAFASGGISGGAFNPAVGFGPNMVNMNFEPMWYYFVGPLVGGALAAVVFKVMNPEG
ncbi:MAG: aquaporin [Bacteroidota bacterium]